MPEVGTGKMEIKIVIDGGTLELAVQNVLPPLREIVMDICILILVLKGVPCYYVMVVELVIEVSYYVDRIDPRDLSLEPSC